MKKPNNTMELDAYKRLLAQQEKDARKAGRKKPGHEESLMQRSCVAWFRAKYPDHAKMLFAVPNGGGRSRIEAGIMKAEGVTAGVSDLLFLEARGGYGALCLEAKRDRKCSKQSKSQKEWQEATVRAGNRYELFRTFEDFTEIMDWYMSLPTLGDFIYALGGSGITCKIDPKLLSQDKQKMADVPGFEDILIHLGNCDKFI